MESRMTAGPRADGVPRDPLVLRLFIKDQPGFAAGHSPLDTKDGVRSGGPPWPRSLGCNAGRGDRWLGLKRDRSCFPVARVSIAAPQQTNHPFDSFIKGTSKMQVPDTPRSISMDVSLPFQRCHAICFASSTFLLIFAIASSFAETPALPSGKHVSLNVPLFFEKNQGQADSAVRFLVRGGQYRLFLTAQGSVLKVAGNHGRDAVLRTTLPGSNPTPEITGMDKQGWMTNYLVEMESDRSSAVANYSRVKYAAVYPGVDLIYHGESHQLEYDFVVSPNAEPSSIRLWIEGANNMSVSADGSIVVQTAAGAVRWEKPVVFQETSGQKTMVTARYQIRGDYIGFQLGPYDRSKTLVIDPALVYGTYLDGTDGFERYTSLLVDSPGFAYVLGSTSSTDFPTTPGALQRQVPSTLGNQLYLSKLNQNGSALVWSTIIGGTGPNNSSFGNGFALDSAGDVFVVGSTADATYST